MKDSHIFITEANPDYELIDSGQGEKLERFGSVILSRPDPQALWHKRLPVSEWKKAQGSFTRTSANADWQIQKDIPVRWNVSFRDLKFWIKPTAFKHVGLFPEQAVNWQWIEAHTPKDGEVLNLFGYTGGASLAAAKAGANVVHIDGSKVAITWARENAELSGLEKKPIRWILDDARAFVKREIKRGRKYSGIIMDPPAFGHGPDNELWKIEEHFLPLIDDCMSILSDTPNFFIINGYSAGYSALAYENILMPMVEKYGGTIEVGELAIRETKMPDLDSRLLPCGIVARWSQK